MTILDKRKHKDLVEATAKLAYECLKYGVTLSQPILELKMSHGTEINDVPIGSWKITVQRLD